MKPLFRKYPNSKRIRNTLICVGILLIAGYTINWWRSYSYCRQRAGASEAVCNTLIAVKNGDLTVFEDLVYSKSMDQKLMRRPSRARKVLAASSRAWGLVKLTPKQIASTVKVVPYPRRSIVISLLLMSKGKESLAEWPGWPQDQPTVVKYRFRGATMISIALKEGGRWKIASLPLVVSEKILNYDTWQEAVAHGDAEAVPAPGE